MSEIDGQIADLKLWDGSTWQLKGWSGINRWIGQVEAMWHPIQEGHVGSDPVNVRGNVIGRWNETKARTQQAQASGITPRDFAPDLANLINEAWGPCHPDSPIGQVVNDLAEGHSYEAAMFAYGILRQVAQPGHAQTLEHARGMVAAVSSDGTSQDQKYLANERKNYRLGIRHLSDAMADAELARADRWTRLLAESTTGMLGWARRRSRVWHDTKTRWTDQRALLVGQLEALEATYREKLSLMAPVKYWEDKAEKHKIAERAAAGRVRWFFIIAIPLVMIMFGVTGWYLITQVRAPAMTAWADRSVAHENHVLALLPGERSSTVLKLFAERLAASPEIGKLDTLLILCGNEWSTHQRSYGESGYFPIARTAALAVQSLQGFDHDAVTAIARVAFASADLVVRRSLMEAIANGGGASGRSRLLDFALNPERQTSRRQSAIRALITVSGELNSAEIAPQISSEPVNGRLSLSAEWTVLLGAIGDRDVVEKLAADLASSVERRVLLLLIDTTRFAGLDQRLAQLLPEGHAARTLILDEAAAPLPLTSIDDLGDIRLVERVRTLLPDSFQTAQSSKQTGLSLLRR